MNNKRKKSVGDILISVLFLSWFAASVLGMLYCSENDMNILVVAIVGQYFLVFGVIANITGIKEHKFKPILLVFPSVGIAAIVGACMLQFGTATVKKAVDASMPYFILGGFLVIGVILVVIALRKYIRPQKGCKESVVATCVEILEQRDDEYELQYCPVYEVFYDNKKMKICSHVFTKKLDVCVGDLRDICFNPNNPEDALDKVVYDRNAFIIGGMGVFTVVASVIALCLMIFL